MTCFKETAQQVASRRRALTNHVNCVYDLSWMRGPVPRLTLLEVRWPGRLRSPQKRNACREARIGATSHQNTKTRRGPLSNIHCVWHVNILGHKNSHKKFIKAVTKPPRQFFFNLQQMCSDRVQMWLFQQNVVCQNMYVCIWSIRRFWRFIETSRSSLKVVWNVFELDVRPCSV